ncbi:MAG: hypothetical protein HYY49_02575 [Ignavibacteriales bacterium]|nr:hypothetical protein [Ignavibacteriales bacterium]
MAVLRDFARSTLQKMTISVTDRPGFLVNCLLLPYLNEALLGLEESTTSPESIDAEARAFGWPMGPFTLLDVIGLDTALTVAEFLSEKYADRMQSGPLLRTLVAMNRLGDKTGAGFYVTHGDRESMSSILAKLYPDRRNDVSASLIFERMMAGLLNEAARALEDDVASKEDIELGAQAGLGCPRGGPLHIIDDDSPAKLVDQLDHFKDRYGSRFQPAPLLQSMASENRKFFTGW